MDVSLWRFPIVFSVFRVFLVFSVGAQSTSRPCLPENRLNHASSCLQRITDALYNENEFFFGKKLDAVCDNTAQNNPDDVNCYVGDENTRKYTIASRLFPAGIRAEGIDRFLTVTFNTSAGTYNACGGSYSIDKRTVDANPDMNPIEPVYVRHKPTFSMKTEPNTYYSIVVVDATYGFVHGYFIGFPDAMKDEIAYRPPFNFRNITNTFLFLAYKQTEKDYMVEPTVVQPMKGQGFGKIVTLDKFASDHALVGPVAVNWMQVKRDPWAIQQVATRPDNQGDDYCVTLVSDAFRLSSFPVASKQFSTIDTVLKVTFTTGPTSVSACCQNYAINASNVVISPLANQVLNAASVRNMPAVSVEKTVVRSKTNVRKYTLLMVDPGLSTPSLATPAEPFLNWLLTDLDESAPFNLNSSILPFIEPLSLPNQSPHRLYFLLYEQPPAGLPNPSPAEFADKSDACPAAYKGRCLYDVETFVQVNQLVLRSVTWVTVQNDLYSAWVMGRDGVAEGTVCAGQKGYIVAGCAKTGEGVTPRQSAGSVAGSVTVLCVALLIALL